MNKWIVQGGYSDGSGDAEFAFSASDKEDAEKIARFLNAGEYMHMRWVPLPLKWISVPREDDNA